MIQGFPIGRMWLDIEQDPAGLGANSLIPKIQQGLATCQAKPGVECGIYTGPGWWKTYLANTSAFTGVPLWYALYNKKRSLSDWTTEKFGGWASPVAKQFQTAPLCGVGGADWNVMQVATTPTRERRSLAAGRHARGAGRAREPVPGRRHGDPDRLREAHVGHGAARDLYQLALERYTGTRGRRTTRGPQRERVREGLAARDAGALPVPHARQERATAGARGPTTRRSTTALHRARARRARHHHHPPPRRRPRRGPGPASLPTAASRSPPRASRSRCGAVTSATIVPVRGRVEHRRRRGPPTTRTRRPAPRGRSTRRPAASTTGSGCARWSAARTATGRRYATFHVQ